jgi:DNA-binding IclR family transcriptional regulator
MDLHVATRAVIHLTVRHELTTLYVERLAGRRDPRIHAAGGARIPLWFTASGKVFIAYCPDPEEILGAMDDSTFPPPTRHSLRRADQLRAQLPTIRDHRWASECEECLEGYKTYAVPIMVGAPQQVMAAVSATLDVRRHDDKAVTQALWAAAADIGRSLQRAGVHTPPTSNGQSSSDR